ncbi:MAG: porin [Roseinatronobacter sp.]|nr:MAG: porin [Roseinatronobacter sp.]
MKKLLLATTALTLSAGVAAADVALSGDARMGLIYDGDDIMMTSRARVTFTLSGETDSGLAFGASFRADQAQGPATGNENMTGGSVFISGDFGRLAMGDVTGAARAAVGDLHGVGLTGLGDLNEMQYIDRLTQGADRISVFDRRTAALYSYSIDAFTIYAGVGQLNSLRGPGSFDLGDTSDAVLAAGDKYTEQQASIGASYSMQGFTGAIGYEMFRGKLTGEPSFDGNHVIASLAYTMDGISVKGIAGRAGGNLGSDLADNPDTRRTQYGLSVSGTFDATTVSAFANRSFFATSYGVGASYDLGGGASIVGGVVRQGANEFAGTDRTTVADFGLSFSF